MPNLKKIFLALPVFAALAFARAYGANAGVIVDSDRAALASARRALECGIPSLARSISERLLKSEFLSDKDAARLLLADSLIAQGLFSAAGDALSEINDPEDARVLLRRAIISLRATPEAVAEDLLSKISVSELPDSDKPWFYISSALLKIGKNDFAAARSLLKLASGFPESVYASREAGVLLGVCGFLDGGADSKNPAAIADLELKSSVLAGTHEGAEFARALACAYYESGRVKDALDKLSDALNLGLLPDSDRDSLELAYALFEPSSAGKIQVLRRVLNGTKSPEAAGAAIYLLRRVYPEGSAEFAAILKDALENGSPLIGDKIMMELAYSSFKSGDFSAMKNYATRMLEEYPASKYKAPLYSLLAWSEFSGASPNYSLAAKYMLEVSKLEQDKTASDFAKFLAADCYYLDSDYESAAEIYKLAVSSSLSEKWRGGAFSQAVDAMLKSGKFEAAVKFADTVYKSVPIGADDVWRAEWLFYLAYRSGSDLDAAKTRVSSLISRGKDGALSADLLVKLCWLEARIFEESGESSKALELVDNLLLRLKTGNLKPSQAAADAAASEAVLIRARVLAGMGRLAGDGGAYAAFEDLRKKYPQSDAAQLSHLLEARLLSSAGAYPRAQALCKTLADAFPDGIYADAALFEAAVYARKIGLEKDYREAVKLLSELVSRYPDSPRVFAAKISQAEILRLMGDFSTAAALCQNIVLEYPSNPENRLALFALADSYLAIPNKANDAAAIFERVYSMPDTPEDLKAEAAFKWGFALKQADRAREAAEVWWMCAGSILKREPSRGEPSPKFRYWAAKTLLELASQLESSADIPSARAAYELIVKYNLPGCESVKSKLLNSDSR